MIKFGPSGTSEDFIQEGHAHTIEMPQWLADHDLDCFEYSFGRGVRIQQSTAEGIGAEFARLGKEISVHAPYFINLATQEEEKAENNHRYIFDSLAALTWFGGKRRKDVTGLDFVHLLCGSEGTLAVVTKAVLKLMPMPRHAVDLLAAFPDAKTAIDFVPKIIKEGGLIPASVEFIDKKALQIVARYLNTEVPAGDAGAALIIQLEDNDGDVIERQYEEIGKLSQKHGAYEVYVADTRSTKERVWQARKNVPEAIASVYKRYTKEDLVVPTASVPELLELLRGTAEADGLEAIVYGHAGDGNMHCTIVAPDCDGWHERLHKAQIEIYEKLLKMGGTLSGEHGIGYKRRGYMKYFLDEAQLELIKRVKLAFDPQNILNPGKIVDWGDE